MSLLPRLYWACQTVVACILKPRLGVIRYVVFLIQILSTDNRPVDNTAYLPANQNGTTESWEAEFVACFFSKGRKDITDAVSRVADVVGLDGMAGSNEVIRKRIEQRIRPFVQAVAPARTIVISVPHPDNQGAPRPLTLGPSDGNGISSQVFSTGGKDADGKTVGCSGPNSFAGYSFAGLQNSLRYAGKQGWAIISDIGRS